MEFDPLTKSLGPEFKELVEVLAKLKSEKGHAHQCLGCGLPTKTYRHLCWRDGKIGPACVSCRRRLKRDPKRSKWIRDLLKSGTL